jgi:MFS family permease
MINAMKKIGNETFASLQVRNYRLYFIGQSVSLCGTWMQAVAQSWLVLTLTHSGVALGLVTAAQFLPILFFGPWAGLLVDCYSKRRMLVFTNIIPAVLALLLGLILMFGTVQLWMVFIFALASGFINAFDNPARQTFAMELVGEDYLANAISLNSAQFNLARVIGPAIAGAFIAAVGLAPCFIINAFSFAAILIALAKMHAEELHPSELAQRAKGQVAEGLR